MEKFEEIDISTGAYVYENTRIHAEKTLAMRIECMRLMDKMMSFDYKLSMRLLVNTRRDKM